MGCSPFSFTLSFPLPFSLSLSPPFSFSSLPQAEECLAGPLIGAAGARCSHLSQPPSVFFGGPLRPGPFPSPDSFKGATMLSLPGPQDSKALLVFNYAPPSPVNGVHISFFFAKTAPHKKRTPPHVTPQHLLPRPLQPPVLSPRAFISFVNS